MSSNSLSHSQQGDRSKVPDCSKAIFEDPALSEAELQKAFELAYR